MSYPLKGLTYLLQSILHLSDADSTGSATFSTLISSCVALWTVTRTFWNAFSFFLYLKQKPCQQSGQWTSGPWYMEGMGWASALSWFFTSTDLTYFWGLPVEPPSLRCIHMYTWTSVISYFGMIYYHFNRNYTFQNLVKTQIF